MVEARPVKPKAFKRYNPATEWYDYIIVIAGHEFVAGSDMT